MKKSFHLMLAARISSILGTLTLIVIGHRFLRMDHHQQELRHAATKAFMESLDQLVGCLESENSAVPEPTEECPDSTSLATSLPALEAAAADIEAFIQAQHSE